MPLCIDLFNVVIVKAAVEALYPDGLPAFRSDLPFDPIQRPHQEDAELLGIATVDADAAIGYANQLIEKGLRYDPDHPEGNDLVIISRYGGPGDHPTWLRFNSLYAWHVECAPALQAKAERAMKLTVDEFLRLQEQGEYPVGPLI